MSSPSRTWPDRAAAAAVALVVAMLAAVPAPAAAAPVPLPVVATVPGGDGRTLLVVDLTDAPADGGRSVTVTHDGAPVAATMSPVAGASMGVTIVVDASAAGAPQLPAWLSAGARFILETPEQARAAVVTDTAPPVLALPPVQGPIEVVRALEAVRPAGGRDTAAALTLAAAQFPEVARGHKVVVLYTTAADAGGESAPALAARYRDQGLLLVVVGPAATGRFWGAAATATGGFFAPAGDPVMVPALDQVRTTLQNRHVVRVPTPQRLPATLSVTMTAGDLELSGRAVVPAPPAAQPDDPVVPSWAWWVVAAAGLVAPAAIALIVFRRRSPATAVPAAPRAPAYGRAVVPAPGEEVARGRARVRPPGGAGESK